MFALEAVQRGDVEPEDNPLLGRKSVPLQRGYVSVDEPRGAVRAVCQFGEPSAIGELLTLLRRPLHRDLALQFLPLSGEPSALPGRVKIEGLQLHRFRRFLFSRFTVRPLSCGAD